MAKRLRPLTTRRLKQENTAMCGCNLQQFKIKVMMRLEICSLATLVSSNLSSFVFQTVNFDLIAFYNPMSKYG
jgi:hypothetical protein